MYKQLAAHTLVATTVVLSLGVGCGSAGGGGACSSLQPLPADTAGNPSPGPIGLPMSQVIEGGLQARITKPGMDKLLATIPSLFGPLLNGICIPKISQQIGPTCFNVTVGACGGDNCANAMPGCPAHVQLTSSDGLDQITATLSDGNNPIIHIDAKFDVDVPLEIDYSGTLVCASASGSCTMDAHSSHYNTTSGAPLEFAADIQTGVDPTTGELTLHLAGMQILNMSLQVGGDCFSGILGDIVQGLINDLLDLLNTQIGQALTDLILQVLQPTLDNLVQSFLPKPLGLAGVLNTGSLLASFNPPKDANMEMFIVPGGYVEGKSGGLTLGVMSGANSDRDPTTRTPDLVSEPSLCVPARMVPNVGGAPWNLPFNALRKDFTLSPAGPFSGNPEPTDANGALQDVAIGLSRTYLNLLGFHFYSSGTLCLEINGSAIPQLNAGTLSLIIQSLGDIVEDKKAPLELVLRPQTPITFTLGAGTMTDPLMHIGITDMRIDFYAWIEERFVRILTLGVDINVGLNLTVTKDANGKPAVEPMLVGVNAQNVTIRVTNTDLLRRRRRRWPRSSRRSSTSSPTRSAARSRTRSRCRRWRASRSTDFSISRVQTTQDDFVGIFANLVVGGPGPIIDWGNPTAPQALGALHTSATLGTVVAPRAEQLRALFDLQDSVVATRGARPTAQLRLTADGAANRPVEYAWRIDNGMWRSWSQDANPTSSATTRFCSRDITRSTCARASSTTSPPRTCTRCRSTCSSTRWRPSCIRRAIRRVSRRSRSTAPTSLPQPISCSMPGTAPTASAPIGLLPMSSTRPRSRVSAAASPPRSCSTPRTRRATSARRRSTPACSSTSSPSRSRPRAARWRRAATRIHAASRSWRWHCWPWCYFDVATRRRRVS